MGDAGGRKRVLVTGAEGIVGTVIRERLGDRYELRSLTRDEAEFPSHVGDIADLDAILPAFEGVDAVVHLAASASVDSTWEQVLSANLIGAYNVFEAARQSGVDLVVFASSNHAVGMYEVDGAPDIYEPGGPVIDHLVEPRPDSLYGVSKVYGEALGRLYSDRLGLRVVCLRIGVVLSDDDPRAEIELEVDPDRLDDAGERHRTGAIWLSHRDCAQLVQRALDSDVRWALVYGVSDNPRRFHDLEHARRVLGYAPEDAAPA